MFDNYDPDEAWRRSIRMEWDLGSGDWSPQRISKLPKNRSLTIDGKSTTIVKNKPTWAMGTPSYDWNSLMVPPREQK